MTVLIGALKDAAVALRSEPVDVVRLDKAITILQSSPLGNIPDLRSFMNVNTPDDLEAAHRLMKE